VSSFPAFTGDNVAKESQVIVRALAAGAVALVITGACLAWAVLAAPHTVRHPIAWGGGAAAIVIIGAVTIAAYYAQAARRGLTRVASATLEVHRMEREFAQLSRETLPELLRRIRDGGEPAAVLANAPAPSTRAVRGLLDTIVREVASAERQATAASAERGALTAEVAQLAGEALPAAIRRMRDGEPADLVLAGAPHLVSGALRTLLDTVVQEVALAEGRGTTAMAACASAAARIQAQTTRMLAELREMENRHGGEEKVFADLMELDHRVSQMGRLADSIALLAGGRSGRRWTKPIPMESILRGAMGRIDAYQRIRLHSTSVASVVGYAAEAVMHALAELMDNAAAFSAHGSEVHVYVEEEDVGVLITIEDSGLGMRKRERSRAEGLVAQPLDLSTLPGTRLGLAVVGRVADRYGLGVNFRPSSRGGTGVVVMVPRQLIAQPREVSDAGPAGGGTGESSGVSAGETDGKADGKAGGESGGEAGGEADGAAVFRYPEPVDDDPGREDDLPVRPRGQTLAAVMPGQQTDAAPALRQSRDSGSRFAAFREAGERPGGSRISGAANVVASDSETRRHGPDEQRGTGER